MFVEHQGKDWEIGRIVGGIGWPSDKPGAVVVIGEELYPRIGKEPYKGDYHFHLLAEAEEYDLGKLLDCCAEFAGRFNVQEVYTKTFFSPAIQTFHTWKSQMGKETSDISLAPYCKETGEINFHLNNVLSLAKKGVLHLSHGPLTEARLREIQPEEIASATDLQFPAIAALAYPLAELSLYPPGYWDQVEEEYDDTVDPITGIY